MKVITSPRSSGNVTDVFIEQRPPGILREYEIDQAIVVMSDRLLGVIDPRSGYIEGSDYLIKDWKPFLNIANLQNATYLRGSYVAALNAATAGNYYHWVYQSFLNAAHFLSNTDDGDEKPTLLVSSDDGFRADYINFLDADHMVAPQHTIMIVERLYWSNYLTHDFAFSPNHDGVSLLRTICCPAKHAATQRLYISRGDTGTRVVENEAACVAMLEERGFEAVQLSSMSVDEQISLFASADIVIAPHGAGLTNIVFSPAGTKVIELVQDNYQNPCFKNLADSSGHDYTAIVNPTRSFGGSHHDDQIEVDLDLLTSVVDRALSGKP